MSKRPKLESGESSSSMTAGAEYHNPGYFYELDHSSLPLVAPAELHVLRAVLVFYVDESKITVKFPSLDSLRTFLDENAKRLEAGEQEAVMGSRPEMDEEFSMTTEVAEKVLVRRISCTELLHQGHFKEFWVADDNEISTPDKKAERNIPPPRWALRRKVRRCRERAERETPKENGSMALAIVNPKPLQVPREMQGRWSNERYKLSQYRLYEILKKKGARPGKLIPRSVLREEARNFIGDTGLLDHLLKHMTDVVLCDNQRLRRRHNSEGAMEYWLEDAGLMDIRKAAGVEDPTWIPPPGWKPGDDIHVRREGMTPSEAARMDDLAQELETLKSDMRRLSTKIEEPPPPPPLLLPPPGPPSPPPSPDNNSQEKFRDIMRTQVEILKSSIEELQNAYVQLHLLHHENATLLGPNIEASNESIQRDQEILRRVERLEENVHWKFEASQLETHNVQTQLSNLWKAVMTLQNNMGCLTSPMPLQDDSWLSCSTDAIIS